MRLPKRGEKGFTLIELLIVVAILGVLAAVVIPNVGRFIGRGEQEAKDTELSNMGGGGGERYRAEQHAVSGGRHDG